MSTKYNDDYDALGERLSGNYYDLPDVVKFFISREFTIEQAKKNDTTPYIKNIEYKENTDSEAGSITIKMSDDSIVKYETSDGKTFNKVGGEGEVESGKKTEEEFKAAAIKGGFDIGKSFVKQTDTKYWGVDNDDTESTTEWNGTTFIVTAGHI